MAKMGLNYMHFHSCRIHNCNNRIWTYICLSYKPHWNKNDCDNKYRLGNCNYSIHFLSNCKYHNL